MLSWILVSTVAVAEPQTVDSINVNSSVVVDEQPVLTVQEIYALLDDERWSKGIVEARRLVAAEPENGLAHLTLGDALSHYPREDGDVYLAFESWMRAKSLTPPRSSIYRVSEKRIGWALDRSGILKLTPTRGSSFSEGFRVEVFSARMVDWSQRIEESNGAVYVTNIPPGDVVLKVTSDLGIQVQRVSVTAGEFASIALPTDTEASSEDTQTNWMPYFEVGRNAVDSAVQSQILDPRIHFDKLEKMMVQLPKAPVPVGSTTTFISPYNERIVYNNGSRQTLVGGLYILEVEKNGVKTFADIVVHPDLSVETIRQLVLNDELRRDVKESPIQRTSMMDSQVIEPDTINAEGTKTNTTAVDPHSNGNVNQDSTLPSDAGLEKENATVSEESISPEIQEVQDVPETKQPENESIEEASTQQDEGAENLTVNQLSQKADQESLKQSSELENVDLTKGFRWRPETAETIQRTTLAIGGAVALCGGVSALRADHFADLANAEIDSQIQFDEYSLKSEQWRSVLVMSSMALGNVASFYLGTKWLEWWAVDTDSESGREQPTETQTDLKQAEGEDQ